MRHYGIFGEVHRRTEKERAKYRTDNRYRKGGRRGGNGHSGVYPALTQEQQEWVETMLPVLRDGVRYTFRRTKTSWKHFQDSLGHATVRLCQLATRWEYLQTLSPDQQTALVLSYGRLETLTVLRYELNQGMRGIPRGGAVIPFSMFDVEIDREAPDGEISDETDRVRAAIARLPERKRDVITQRLQGFSCSEIGKDYGVCGQAIKRTEVEALAMLRYLLNPDEDKLAGVPSTIHGRPIHSFIAELS